MVAKRSGPGIDALRDKYGEDVVDEHIAIVGPRNSGKSFLARALANAFHDGGRGNSVILLEYRGRVRNELVGWPGLHTITIHDGYLPDTLMPALRVISTDSLG